MNHIAIFVPVLNGGGAERMMRHLAEEFARRRIRCDLIVATDKGPALHAPPTGVRVVRLHKTNSRRAILSLFRYTLAQRPDVVMSTVFSANIAAIIATKVFVPRTRLILREASRTDAQIGANHRLRRWIDATLKRTLYPRADHVVAVSRDVQAHLIDSGLIRRDRLSVISNPLTRNVSGIRYQARSRSVRPMILACGRLEVEKDYPTLLRALKIIVDKHDVELSILGAGSLMPVLELLALNLGVRARVSFVGFVEDIRPFLARASIFAHTSRYEGFPSALLEAVAAGCPVVATDSPGGAREILREGELGSLVPVGDEQAVAKAITDILDGTVTFRTPAGFEESHSLSAAADSYLQLLFPSTPMGQDPISHA